MKKLTIVLVVIAAALLGYFALIKQESPLENAALAESRGDYEKAREQYIEALLEMTKTTKFPDKNRSKIVSQDVWYKDVDRYLNWATAKNAPTTASLVNIIEGLKRCSTHVSQEVLYTVDSTAMLDTNAYVANWQRAFFPSGVAVEGNHGPLIARAMSQNVAFLRILALTSYTYHASLIDMDSWRRTDFTVYPEDEITLLAKPGTYLLVVSSEVTFPNGQLWKSARNVLYVSNAEGRAFSELTIKTRVSR